MENYYVFNLSELIFMFKSTFFKSLSQGRFSVPLIIYTPHHYTDATKGYGMNTAMWDGIFKTNLIK